MRNRTVRLSKPLYESLPFVYIATGLCGFLVAYLLAGTIWSDIALVLGILGVMSGLVIMLRRRDYRATRAQYTGATFSDNGSD